MVCDHCGRKATGQSAFCSACKRPLAGYSIGQAAAVAANRASTTADAAFAGFWLRFGAALIDAVILALALGVVASALAVAHLQPLAFTQLGAGDDPGAVMKIYGRDGIVQLLVFFVVASWLYFAFSESSSVQASPGKRLIGLYVVDSDGNRPSFLRATSRFSVGRLIAHIPGVGLLYFLIDCICAGVTPKKQAVHDMISGCLVLRRPPRFQP
jgi:uncharacterized RDD family membrane protein YckC